MTVDHRNALIYQVLFCFFKKKQSCILQHYLLLVSSTQIGIYFRTYRMPLFCYYDRETEDMTELGL